MTLHQDSDRFSVLLAQIFEGNSKSQSEMAGLEAGTSMVWPGGHDDVHSISDSLPSNYELPLLPSSKRATPSQMVRLDEMEIRAAVLEERVRWAMNPDTRRTLGGPVPGRRIISA
ncbi:MAG: hypothetical protein M1816_000445 [Peltula sp. TS41687]|nr:MAG: hypothetical protein M1816_000445 [Peltula sp. TS41687]